MGIDSRNTSTVPDITMPITQVPPEQIYEFGFDIIGLVNDTFIAYIKGLFSSTPGLSHSNSYNETANPNKKIHITDPGGNDRMEQGVFPRIVVDSGDFRGLGMTGINSRSSLNFKTGEEGKVEMFSGNVSINVYGKFTEVRQYASLIFMSLTFLTRPLKLFTIYKVGKPALSRVRKFRSNQEATIWFATISLNVWKEGSVSIINTNAPVLQDIVFKCNQVFDMSNQTRVVVNIT